jgi:hypothetical protein
MTALTIDVRGRPDAIQLAAAFDTLQDAALVIDAALKRCRDLWQPADEHAVDPGQEADHATFEPVQWLDAGLLSSELIRAGADSGHRLNIVGVRDGAVAAARGRLVLAQHEVEPRSLVVRLISGDAEDLFEGRHDDFLGWVKRDAG